MIYAKAYLHIGQDGLDCFYQQRGAKPMTKLTIAEAIKLAFECGKARDSKAFAKVVLQVSVKDMKFSELRKHYEAGMKA